MIAFSSADAQAFGLFDHFSHSGCDACGEVIAEPTCGLEAPACGCEVVEPCCDSGKPGLLHRLFNHHGGGCDSCCGEIIEPACGFEAPIVEPACGCGAVGPCDCGGGCHKRPFGGFFHNLLKGHGGGCDACGGGFVEPTCGLEAAPACGCGV